MLDGLCMMQKIKRVSKGVYAGLDVEAASEEVELVTSEPVAKKKRQKKQEAVTNNNEDSISFSEDIQSATDKLNELLESSVIVDRPTTIEYLEKTVSSTGRKICDAMNTRMILHKVTVAADEQGVRNVEVEHTRIPYKTCFSIKMVGNKIEFYRFFAHPRNGNLGHEEREFDGYKDVKEFILSNL